MRIDVNHYVAQFLTGHGNFNAYLKRFGKRESELCDVCGVCETPEHVVYDCVDIAASRAQFEEALRELGVRLDLRRIVQNPEAVRQLSIWLTTIGRLREGRGNLRAQ